MEHVAPGEASVYHDRLYAAVWDEEKNIEDPEVLSDLAADLSVPAELVERVVTNDELWPAVASSMERAHAWGATGTPSWVIDNKLMVPGLQDDDFFDRVINKLSTARDNEASPE